MLTPPTQHQHHADKAQMAEQYCLQLFIYIHIYVCVHIPGKPNISRITNTKTTSATSSSIGSYNGAEMCKLVRNFLLSQLQNLYINISLTRRTDQPFPMPHQDTENIKKEICCIFNHNGLWITIETNKQTINFLDVTFKRE